jgi:hypothetical protein
VDGNVPLLVGPGLLVESAQRMANLVGDYADKVAARGGDWDALNGLTIYNGICGQHVPVAWVPPALPTKEEQPPPSKNSSLSTSGPPSAKRKHVSRSQRVSACRIVCRVWQSHLA